MRIHWGAAYTLISLLVLPLTPQTYAQIVTNGSFELPAIPSNTLKYSPSSVIVSNWTFYTTGPGGCGLFNGSGGQNFLPPTGGVGGQYAFLQKASASMWQTITLPTNTTGTYTLTYLVAGRHDGGGTYQGNVTYSVMLDSAILQANAKTTSAPYTPSFISQTVSFNASPGNHILTFTNSPNQPDTDDMAFFDNIQIVNGTPPPQFVTNGSFELPIITNGVYPYDAEYASQPGINASGWTYASNQDGVVLSPPGFPPGFVNAQSAIDGRQVAFLQNSNAAIWQTIVLPANGTYDLTYYFAGRPQLTGTVRGNVTNYVLIDSTILATNTTFSAQPFTFGHVNFFATTGSHVLMFSNSAALPDDNTMFLDDVQIVQAAPITVAAYAGLKIAGSVGTNYTVVFSTNLPVTSWISLTNVLLSNNPSFYVDLTSAGTPGQRFYNCTAPAPAQAALLGIGIYAGYNIQGETGKLYGLQYLNPLPATTWTTITNVTLPISPYLWLDSGSQGRPAHAYYRAVLLHWVRMISKSSCRARDFHSCHGLTSPRSLQYFSSAIDSPVHAVLCYR